MDERIYVVIPEVIYGEGNRKVIQPAGRQIAQACHVVTELLRNLNADKTTEIVFEERTIIILQARDYAEMKHVYNLLADIVYPVLYADTNIEYGRGRYYTALAVLATPITAEGILDYLPLWGNK